MFVLIVLPLFAIGFHSYMLITEAGVWGLDTAGHGKSFLTGSGKHVSIVFPTASLHYSFVQC